MKTPEGRFIARFFQGFSLVTLTGLGVVGICDNIIPELMKYASYEAFGLILAGGVMEGLVLGVLGLVQEAGEKNISVSDLLLRGKGVRSRRVDSEETN